MDQFLRQQMGWAAVETGTLNICLDDYRSYAHARRVDFLIPHCASPLAPWDCYFERCAIDANGKSVDAVIATTGDNFWGKRNGTIEVRASVKLRTTLSLIDGSIITVIV
jgi:hypothetical protein